MIRISRHYGDFRTHFSLCQRVSTGRRAGDIHAIRLPLVGNPRDTAIGIGYRPGTQSYNRLVV